MKVDLHVHTTESDGMQSIEEVVSIAHENQVQILGVTDHESTGGIAKAQKLAETLQMRIMPGLEFVTTYRDVEVHLLGYFNHVDHPVLQSRLKEIRQQRTALAYDMVEQLQRSDINITWQEVEKEIHAEVAVSKGHIMRAIYKKETGSNRNWRRISAFFRPGGVAYLPFREHRFQDAADLIFACGGLPVIAHPGLLSRPEIIFDLLAYRPMGLEVYYGYWENRQKLVSYYAEMAEKSALLATGGSDYHGPGGFIQIGQMEVPMTCVEKLQAYLAGV